MSIPQWYARMLHVCYVSQAHVTASVFSAAEFRHADLTGTDFRDADMTCVDFGSADMTDAQVFRTVNMADAHFSYAIIQGATFRSHNGRYTPEPGTPPFMVPHCGARTPVPEEAQQEAALACADHPDAICPEAWTLHECDEDRTNLDVRDTTPPSLLCASHRGSTSPMSLQVCRRTCGECDAIKRGCSDSHAGCGQAAARGQCATMPHLTRECPWSCGTRAHRIGAHEMPSKSVPHGWSRST